MDPKLFETLGKYAGLAGICIGLVLLVFLAILKKDSTKENLSLLKQMMYLTFFIGVIGIAAWVIVQPRTPAKDDSGKKQKTQETVPDPTPPVAKPAPPEMVISPEEETRSPETASGACKGYGNWARLCSNAKPAGWTIVSEHFDLIGDRAGCKYAECKKDDETSSNTQVCYLFHMQGHDEECGHSGNTGIQYSTGVLKVVWKHPAP
jgi:hypothetical protein